VAAHAEEQVAEFVSDQVAQQDLLERPPHGRHLLGTVSEHVRLRGSHSIFGELREAERERIAAEAFGDGTRQDFELQRWTSCAPAGRAYGHRQE
jgi:hypothetical protein